MTPSRKMRRFCEKWISS